MKTVELYSLADKYATNRTIANAIGWNPFDLSLGQIDYLWNKEKFINGSQKYKEITTIQNYNLRTDNMKPISLPYNLIITITATMY